MLRNSIEAARSGKWSTPGVPHRGWQCIDIEERDDQDYVCEMCETQMVRFVHVMTNARYDGELRVGCVCAGHMEGDLEQARRREIGFKNGRSRRKRWLSRAWRVSSGGNYFINTNDGFNIVIYRLKDGGWGGRIMHRETEFTRRSRLRYSTQDEAKLAAFDAMLALKQIEPWRIA